MSDVINDFRRAMERRSLIPPAELLADGKLHRCEVAGGKKNNRDGSYLLHLDGRAAGGLENFRDGQGWENWVVEAERPLSPDEAERQRVRIEADQKARAADEARRKREAADKARYVWDNAEPARPDHSYLVRKGVLAHGIRESRGNLVVPVRDAGGVITSLQFIKPDGGKLFLSGGRKAGCWHQIGDVVGSVVLVEGYATGATVHEVAGLAMAVAFDAGNLAAVARELRAKYPDAAIVIAADDDFLSEGNPGLAKAIEAAQPVGGLIAIPDFGDGREPGDTDFNDLAGKAGEEAVRRDIAAARPAGEVAELLARRAHDAVGSPSPDANSIRADGATSSPPAAAPPAATAKRPTTKRGSPFRMGKTGVEKKIETEAGEEWRWFCSPIDILAATRDARGEDWGRLVKVTDMDGQSRTWSMPMAMLAGDGGGYRERLLSMGVSIAPSKFAKDALHEYLSTARPEARLTCVNRVGWHGDVFVLPDRSYAALAANGVASETMVLQSAGALDHAFNIGGDAETWRRDVASLAVGNSRLLLSMGAAFAAPLVRLLGMEGGGCHFRGLSSIGKSTITEVAGSVWGGSSKGYAKSWRSTDNALESLAAMHCDSLLILDEIAAVNPLAAAASAYMLSAGVGKHRASRNGDGRPVLEWKIILLSTGEISLADKIAEDGKGGRAMAGQQARLIDLPADAGAGHGVFNELHGYESGDVLARALKAGSAAHYGHAAREFLSAITGDLPAIREMISGIQKDFVGKHCPPGADGQVLRVASRFGLIAAAGELAASLDVVPWPAGEATAGVAQCLADWIAERGGVGAQEDSDAIRHVRKFVETYGTARFERMYDEDADGTQAPSSERTLNRVGFRLVAKDCTDYFVLPESWKTEVCKGFDARHVAKVLLERGMLQGDSAGKSTRLKRMPGFAKPIRVYCLTQKLMDDN